MDRKDYNYILREARSKKFELLKDEWNEDNICIGICEQCNHPRWCFLKGERYSLEKELFETIHDRKIIQERVQNSGNRSNKIQLTKILEKEKKLKEEYKNLKKNRVVKI